MIGYRLVGMGTCKATTYRGTIRDRSPPSEPLRLSTPIRVSKRQREQLIHPPAASPKSEQVSGRYYKLKAEGRCTGCKRLVGPGGRAKCTACLKRKREARGEESWKEVRRADRERYAALRDRPGPPAPIQSPAQEPPPQRKPLGPSPRFQLNRKQRALVLNPPPLRTVADYNYTRYYRLKAEGRCVECARPVGPEGAATCAACCKRERRARAKKR